jgi:hypothetical protein
LGAAAPSGAVAWRMDTRSTLSTHSIARGGRRTGPAAWHRAGSMAQGRQHGSGPAAWHRAGSMTQGRWTGSRVLRVAFPERYHVQVRDVTKSSLAYVVPRRQVPRVPRPLHHPLALLPHRSRSCRCARRRSSMARWAALVLPPTHTYSAQEWKKIFKGCAQVLGVLRSALRDRRAVRRALADDATLAAYAEPHNVARDAMAGVPGRIGYHGARDAMACAACGIVEHGVLCSLEPMACGCSGRAFGSEDARVGKVPTEGAPARSENALSEAGPEWKWL